MARQEARGWYQQALWQPLYHRPVGKLIKIALVVFGIRAFLRWRKSRQQQDSATQQHESATITAAAPASDPADELRRKLAESREDEEPAGAPTPPEASVTDRRSEVHEQGRAALDEMKPTDEV